jgi:hypothetical protein
MTPRQALYRAWRDHCEKCEQCSGRPTFESPRCQEGEPIFQAWWSACREDFPQRRLI